MIRKEMRRRVDELPAQKAETGTGGFRTPFTKQMTTCHRLAPRDSYCCIVAWPMWLLAKGSFSRNTSVNVTCEFLIVRRVAIP